MSGCIPPLGADPDADADATASVDGGATKELN